MRESLFDPYPLETLTAKLFWRRQMSVVIMHRVSSSNISGTRISDIYIATGYISYPWPSPAEGIVHSVVGCGRAFVSWISLPRATCPCICTFVDQRRHLGWEYLTPIYLGKVTPRVDNAFRRNWLNGWLLPLKDLHTPMRGFCMDT